MQEIVTTDHEIIIPRINKPGLPPIVVDLGRLALDEARTNEVAQVNHSTAPELMSFCNEAWRNLGKTIALIRKEYNSSKVNTKSVHARILLDEAGAILEAKGLSKTKDMMSAVVDRHPDAINAFELEHSLACVLEHLTIKLNNFANAFTATKKIIDGSAGRGRYTTSGDTGVEGAGAGEEKNPYEVRMTAEDIRAYLQNQDKHISELAETQHAAAPTPLVVEGFGSAKW